MDLFALPHGLSVSPLCHPSNPTHSTLLLPRTIAASFSRPKILGLNRFGGRLAIAATSEKDSSVVVKEESVNKWSGISSFIFGDPGEHNSSDDDVGEDGKSSQSLLSKINLQLDSEETTTYLVYGASALAALWISSAVVSAIESIPVFPKLMEVVGLGYTVWFTTRYLIYKDSREELLTTIADLKTQIIGSDDDD